MLARKKKKKEKKNKKKEPWNISMENNNCFLNTSSSQIRTESKKYIKICSTASSYVWSGSENYYYLPFIVLLKRMENIND